MRRWPAYLLVFFLILLGFTRCAQIVAPTGGPKDTLPPFLISATPPDSTLRFKASNIELNFNEFIQLQDLQKQLIIAPNPKRQPEIRSKLRTISIRWTDTLKPNTTYTINMGNAIQDIDEGNPLKNFRYVFATGDYLDSLEISGRILDAETGLPDSLVSVMLYDSLEDSVVTKDKPLYYARTAGDGNFLFQNLPHGVFKLFAIRDGNGDLIYDDSTEAIAFVPQPLHLDSSIGNINLYDFLEKATTAAKDTTAPAPPEKGKEEKKRKLTTQAQLNSGAQDLNRPLTIHFSAPLVTYDSARLQLSEDTSFRPVSFGFSLDSTRQSIALSYKWKEETPYRLIIDTSFAVDTGGIRLTGPDTLQFKTKALSDYGSLTLGFEYGVPVDTAHVSSDSTLVHERQPVPAIEPSDSGDHYVVQLMHDKDMIASAPLKNNTWKIPFLDPGDYQVRVLKDDNGNGVWDRGCYYCPVKRQPEKVFTLPGKFNVKANWDNDYNHLKFFFLR